MNDNNTNASAAMQPSNGTYPFPQQRLVKQGNNKATLAFTAVIAVLLVVIAVLLMVILNGRNTPIADSLITPTPVITSTPAVTATVNPTGSVNVTPSVTVTPSTTTVPVAMKTFTSTIFRYSFQYPTSWNLIESQGDPAGGPDYTGETGYIRSANNALEFDWEVGDRQSDGGDVARNIMVNGRSIPLRVVTEGARTCYIFEGGDSVLGIDIPGISRINFSFYVNTSENQETALNTLVDILETFRAN